MSFHLIRIMIIAAILVAMLLFLNIGYSLGRLRLAKNRRSTP